MTEAVYLIRKQGLWYRPRASGYTDSVIQAGRYTLEEAQRYTHPNGPDGPRDGMDYVHENDLVDPDWQMVKDLRHRLDLAVREQDRLARAVESQMKEKHKEAREAKLWFEKAHQWREQFERAIKWLTPSAETKAEFIGEFSFSHRQFDAHGDEYYEQVTVPWTTTKEIMQAIRQRVQEEDGADQKTTGADQASPDAV